MSDEPFITHRSLLFTVAYEMLGSAADAEDVVQEVWLRWADLGDAARNEVRIERELLRGVPNDHVIAGGGQRALAEQFLLRPQHPLEVVHGRPPACRA